MFRFFIALAAIIFVSLAALVSVFLYATRSEVADIRFTVHAEFYDGETPYVGSSVWELHIEQGRFLAQTSFESVRGEAIQLKGPGSRHLFLLLHSSEDAQGLPVGTFLRKCTGGSFRTNVEMIANLRENFSGPCSLDQALPLLVEFAMLDDPRTLRRVPYIRESGGSCDGLCLARLWIERTDEPATTGIVRIVPWLTRLEYSTAEIVTGKKIVALAPDSKILMRVDFSTEISGKWF
ncbi:MAG: hypothetical protein ACOH2L_16850 [Devosia sp.]